MWPGLSCEITLSFRARRKERDDKPIFVSLYDFTTEPLGSFRRKPTAQFKYRSGGWLASRVQPLGLWLCLQPNPSTTWPPRVDPWRPCRRPTWRQNPYVCQWGFLWFIKIGWNIWKGVPRYPTLHSPPWLTDQFHEAWYGIYCSLGVTNQLRYYDINIGILGNCLSGFCATFSSIGWCARLLHHTVSLSSS